MNAYFVVPLFVFAWNAPLPIFLDGPAARAADDKRVVVPVNIQRGALRGEGRTVQAKITIPRDLLPGNNGAAVGAPAPAAAPAPNAPAAAPVPRIQLIPPPGARSSTPPMGMTIAGIAMSLAAVSLAFMLRGSRTKKAVCLIVLGGSLTFTVLSIARADIAGQKRVRPPNAPPETEIVIEVTDFGDAVTLQLR